MTPREFAAVLIEAAKARFVRDYPIAQLTSWVAALASGGKYTPAPAALMLEVPRAFQPQPRRADPEALKTRARQLHKMLGGDWKEGSGGGSANRS